MTARVFLSYAWEDDLYRKWVEQLALRLLEDGFEARLDRWHLAEGQSIAQFINSEVRGADKVLVLCSPAYRLKVHQTEDGGPVTGSGWEAGLVADQLFANLGGARGKVIAVLARGSWQEAAPDFLLGLVYADLSELDTFESQYLGLLRRLTGSPPPVGPGPGDIRESVLPPLRGPDPATVKAIPEPSRYRRGGPIVESLWSSNPFRCRCPRCPRWTSRAPTTCVFPPTTRARLKSACPNGYWFMPTCRQRFSR